MTLTNKIILLVSFMFLISLSVFYWFTNFLFQHTSTFKQSMAIEKQQLQERLDEGIAEIHHKGTQLSQEIVGDLKKMEDDLVNNQRKAEEFDKAFLEGQNGVFDAIDAFGSGGPAK